MPSSTLADAPFNAATVPPRFVSRFLPVAALGGVGIVAIVPEQIRIADRLLPQAVASLPPRELLIAASLLQPALLMLLLAALGAVLAHRYGLVSLVAHRQGWQRFRRGLPAALGLGVLAGVGIAAADAWIFRGLEPQYFENARALAGSPGEALAMGALYGGLTEEVMMRWGLMPVFCWLACRFGGRPNECSPLAMGNAIVLSAVLFAAAHLPAVSLLAPLSDSLLLRTLVLNTLAGIAFGWLFWRYTLESAMLSHATVHGVFFVVAVTAWS